MLSDGSVHADKEYTSPFADYAEYFEWADGDPSNNDRAEWSAVGVLGSSAAKGKLPAVLDRLANRIKAITGQNSWQANPPVTLVDCSKHIWSSTHQNASVNANGFMSYSDKQKLDNTTSEYI